MSRTAYGVFRQGVSTVGQYIGVAGELLSGEAIAAKTSRALRRPVYFVDVPFDTCRGLGFSGVGDLANMCRFHAVLGDEFQRRRDAERARALNPALLGCDAWLTANVA